MVTRSIKIFGKSVISTLNHTIMSISYKEDMEHIENSLGPICITDNLDLMIEGLYSKKTIESLVRSNPGKCDVFVFRDNNNEIVGTTSIMYKGGNETEYKIRNIDAFFFNVYVVEEKRGRGYGVGMMHSLVKYLHKQSIDKAYLAVSTNNTNANRCYYKAGFVDEFESSFIRVLRINIPYREL